ncbi:MAG: 2-amino-4-hydroxy-6-hydroxymethyldihydropteridine diphosphokinase [Eubacterium sp.]|nr:2-amino-4-hydroxy-6-hydroxymethyldihydropteridine diphosphokinase [Eubacterium sp.]
MDKIVIKDLEIFAHHGVRDEENALGQKFLVSVTIFTDIGKACSTDDISYSIDYNEISHFVDEKMRETKYKLIESAAEHIARSLLMEYERIERVRVEIKKPWAPILLPLNTVGVCIERGWHRAYIGIGSNLGDREGYIRSALEKLNADSLIRNVVCSDIIETEPYGVTDQPDFLNAAAAIDTLYSPEGLLDKLHDIENGAKRQRDLRWGPRTLDLDILLYDDEIIQTGDLQIPHKDMHNREFVLKPLSRIAPWKLHPVFGTTINQLYERLENEK